MPGWLGFIVCVLIAVIVIILFALVVHALGGFSFGFRAGHFHFGVGVS